MLLYIHMHAYTHDHAKIVVDRPLVVLWLADFDRPPSNAQASNVGGGGGGGAVRYNNG